MATNETFAAMSIDIEQLPKAPVRRVVCCSEVVIGEDRETGERVIFFGCEALDDWANGRRSVMPQVVMIRYDGSTGQRDYLAVCTYRLKGSCCHGDADQVIGEAMAGKVTRFADAESGRTVTIPARELTGGVVRVQKLGETEPAWMELPAVRPSAVRRSRLGGGLRKRVKAIRRAFAEVYPLTTRRWEERFRRDAHPEREVAVWEHLAACYAHFVQDGEAGPEEKEEIFRTIVAASCNGAWHTGQTLKPRWLSNLRMREVAAFVEQTWSRDDWPPAPPGRVTQ